MLSAQVSFDAKIYRLVGRRSSKNRFLKRSRAIAEPRELTIDQSKAPVKLNEGHSALLQGLGEIGDVPTVHVPWLLRLAHIRSARQQLSSAKDCEMTAVLIPF